jgi:hypothetical protein
MNFDISTFTGVLGVVLTIVFFAVGYRQTIGGRKERARSANKHLAEALFRRLALDDRFPINLAGVSKLIMGSALEAKVRLDDLYTPEQLEAVLYAKIVESDYLPDDRRVVVLEKLSQCFAGEEQQHYIQVPARDRRRIGSEARLALLSAAMAGSLSVLTATIISVRGNDNLFDGMDLGTTAAAVAALAGLLVATAVVLAMYTRLRENSVSTAEQSVSAQRAEEYERKVVEELVSDGFIISAGENPAYDFRVEGPDGDIGVEVKYDINQLSLSQIKSKFAKLDELCKSGHIAKAVIISSRSPLPEVRRLRNSNVTIMPRYGFKDYLSGKRSRVFGVHTNSNDESLQERIGDADAANATNIVEFEGGAKSQPGTKNESP